MVRIVRIFRLFSDSEEYYLSVDYVGRAVEMINSSELSRDTLDTEILVSRSIFNAWDTRNSYIDCDESIAYMVFIRDRRGVLYRLKFNFYSDGRVSMDSLVLGISDEVVTSVFGKSLFDCNGVSKKFTSSMFDSLCSILLETQSDDNLSLHYDYETVDINGDEGRLYMKIFRDELQIPYIVFKNRRVGTGRRIVLESIRICRELGLSRVVFLGVMTDEMVSFCEKLNFRRLKDNGFGHYDYELVVE